MKNLRGEIESLRSELNSTRAALEDKSASRIQASLEMLRCILESDHVKNGCAMITPETVTDVFKAAYRAIAEVEERLRPTPYAADSSAAKGGMTRYQYQPVSPTRGTRGNGSVP